VSRREGGDQGKVGPYWNGIVLLVVGDTRTRTLSFNRIA